MNIKMNNKEERAMRQKIATEFDLCTGCTTCQLECSFRAEGGYNPRLALLKLDQHQEGLYTLPVVCNQCQNAFCMKVCPAGAIEIDEAMGIPVVKEEQCTGCGMCRDYCPLGVVLLKKNGRAAKCDLCQGDPRCIKSCPTGALYLSNGGEQNEQQ